MALRLSRLVATTPRTTDLRKPAFARRTPGTGGSRLRHIRRATLMMDRLSGLTGPFRESPHISSTANPARESDSEASSALRKRSVNRSEESSSTGRNDAAVDPPRKSRSKGSPHRPTPSRFLLPWALEREAASSGPDVGSGGYKLIHVHALHHHLMESSPESDRQIRPS